MTEPAHTGSANWLVNLYLVFPSKSCVRIGTGPSLIILAHCQEPLESLFDPRVVFISCLDEQCHNCTCIVGGILIGKKTAYVAILSLARKEKFSSLPGRCVLSVKPIYLYQKSELLPCFNQAVVDIRRFILTGINPRAVMLLLLEVSSEPQGAATSDKWILRFPPEDTLVKKYCSASFSEERSAGMGSYLSSLCHLSMF